MGTPTTKLKGPLTHPRILLLTAVVYTLGIVCGSRCEIPALLCMALAGIFLCIGMLLRKRLTVCVMAAILCLGIWAGAAAIRPAPAPAEGVQTLHGVVDKRIPGETYHTYRLRSVTVEGEKIPYRVLLYSENEYAPGDEVLAQAELSLPVSAMHPGDFDDARYCATQHVGYRAFAQADAKTGERNGIVIWIQKLSARFGEYIEELFPENPALAKAFILGDEADVEVLQKQQLNLTGMTHILSISGSHIAILAAALHLCFRYLKLDRRIPFWITQAVMVFYTVLTGWKVSMVRALCMYEVTAWGRFLGKKSDPLTSLAAAYLLCIGGNPAQVFDLGLQLSFGAVFGMICLGPTLSEKFSWLRWEPLYETLAAGVAAAITTFPITVTLNHYYWLPGIVANVLGVLYSVVMIPVLLGIAAVSLISGGLLDCFGSLGDLLINGFTWFVDLCAGSADIGFYLPAMAAGVALLWYGVVFLCSDKVFLPVKYKRIAALGLAVVVLAGVLLPLLPPKKNELYCFAEERTAAILTTEAGYRAALMDGDGEGILEYALHQGLRFDCCILTDTGRSAIEAAVQLYEMGRCHEIYASDQVREVLRYKYGIFHTRPLPEELRLGGRVWLRSVCEGNGWLLYEGGEARCLIVLDYHEQLRSMVEEIPVLYYHGGVHSDLPGRMPHDTLIYADAGSGNLPKGINLYQRGMTVVAF